MPTPNEDPAPLAPRWHTALLVFVIVAVAGTGTLLGAQGVPQGASAAAVPPRLLATYLPLILVQWSLAFYVCRVGRPRSALRPLLGVPWNGDLRRIATDVGLAVAGWLLILATEHAWALLFARKASPTVATLLPHTGPERLAWVVVAVSVGFCEELVYRGYLRVQLSAFTRSTGAGLVLQAVLFGLAHADQGLAAIPRVALYGLGFGLLARWRGSLWPGILCHVGTDVVSGLWHG